MENEIIKNSLQEKGLGIMIDNMLTFEPHVENVCKKTGQKLHALQSCTKYLRQTLVFIWNSAPGEKFNFCF